MITNEPEYRIEKCNACGQDKKGPRIIRPNEPDKQEIIYIKEQIKKKDRLFNLAIGLGMISCFVTLVAGLIFFKEAEPPTIMIIAGVVYLCVTLPFVFLTYHKDLHKRLNKILQSYDISQDEEYEIL